MGLPPVVVGLVVALLLFRGAPLGGLDLLYTLEGVIAAQTLLSLPLVAALTAFGEEVGVAFQISDDLIDIVSADGVSGKSPGTDLREGVATLPVLFALAGDDPAEARLRELVVAPLPDEGEHAEALALLRSSAALDRATDVLREYADRARARLADVPEGDVRDALSALCDYVVTRTS